MRIYCTSTNFQPRITYLGTSFKEAQEAADTFEKFEKDLPKIEHQTYHTHMSRGIPFEMLQYFENEGYWWSIVAIDIGEEE